MTCIVGFEDTENKKVYLGADSSANCDNKKLISGLPKVFTLGEFVIGIAGYFRIIQLIQYSLELPKQSDTVSDMYYLVNVFAKLVSKCIEDNKIDSYCEDIGFEIIFGYRGNLYMLNDNYQIVKSKDNYAAIGSGKHEALAVMKTLEALNDKSEINKKLVSALYISSYFNSDVYEPFLVISK